jgi:hypothetical protein
VKIIDNDEGNNLYFSPYCIVLARAEAENICGTYGWRVMNIKQYFVRKSLRDGTTAELGRRLWDNVKWDLKEMRHVSGEWKQPLGWQ